MTEALPLDCSKQRSTMTSRVICRLSVHMKVSFKKCRSLFSHILNIITLLIARSFFTFEYSRAFSRSLFFFSHILNIIALLIARSLFFFSHILNIIAHIIARDFDHNMKNSSMLTRKRHHNRVALCLILFECFEYNKLTLNERNNVMRIKIN
jgi:hypothetical protein